MGIKIGATDKPRMLLGMKKLFKFLKKDWSGRPLTHWMYLISFTGYMGFITVFERDLFCAVLFGMCIANILQWLAEGVTNENK